MKKNKILITVNILIILLLMGCSEKNIVLNDNVVSEQSGVESKLELKEKKLNINFKSGVNFNPIYIGDDGIYGLVNSKDKSDYSFRRVTEDGVIWDVISENDKYNNLPYKVEKNGSGEIIYKNYVTNEEKIITLNSGNQNYYSENYESYIIKNSPYVAVVSVINGDGQINNIIDIVNMDTLETFNGDLGIRYKNNNYNNQLEDKINETFFYLGEKNIIYSLANADGVIKKIKLHNGGIETETYDIIYNFTNSDNIFNGIYTNGLETRIIYTQSTYGIGTVYKQLSYKVATKEHEILYDEKNKNKDLIYVGEMIPNELMLCKINEEYKLIKFDEYGIEVVYKFDFTEIIDITDDIIRDARIVSDRFGKKIIITLLIENYETNEIREEYKMYEIIE